MLKGKYIHIKPEFIKEYNIEGGRVTEQEGNLLFVSKNLKSYLVDIEHIKELS